MTIIHLVNEIIERARQKGMSQKDLARAAHIGEVSLSRAKTANDISFTTLEQLASAVGLRIVLAPALPLAQKVMNGTLFE